MGPEKSLELRVDKQPLTQYRVQEKNISNQAANHRFYLMGPNLCLF